MFFENIKENIMKKSMISRTPMIEKDIYITENWFPDIVTIDTEYSWRLKIYLDDELMQYVIEAKRGKHGYVKYFRKNMDNLELTVSFGNVRLKI